MEGAGLIHLLQPPVEMFWFLFDKLPGCPSLHTPCGSGAGRECFSLWEMNVFTQFDCYRIQSVHALFHVIGSWGPGSALWIQRASVPAWRGLSAQLPAPVYLHGRSGWLHAPLSSTNASAWRALLAATVSQAWPEWLLWGMGVWRWQPHQWGDKGGVAQLPTRSPAPS